VLHGEKLKQFEFIGNNTVIFLELLRKFKSAHKISVKKELSLVRLYSKLSNFIDETAVKRLQSTMSIVNIDLVNTNDLPQNETENSKSWVFSDCGNFAVYCEYSE
jgi:hypothetical protein